MRSFLIRLLILLAVLLVVVWVALPWGASWLVTSALNASGFTGTDTHVEVTANPPPLLLTGHADSVHITSSQVGIGDLHAATMDFTLSDVSLVNRTLGSVDGTLTNVRVPAPDGEPVSIERASVKGDARAAVATLEIGNDEAEQLLASQLKQQSGIVATFQLAPPDKVTLTAGGQSQPCTLQVVNGALIMVPTSNDFPSITLIKSGGGNPFTLTSVAVSSERVTLMGTIDVQALLGI